MTLRALVVLAVFSDWWGRVRAFWECGLETSFMQGILFTLALHKEVTVDIVRVWAG
jgi:hypothetical protein